VAKATRRASAHLSKREKRELEFDLRIGNCRLEFPYFIFSFIFKNWRLEFHIFYFYELEIGIPYFKNFSFHIGNSILFPI